MMRKELTIELSRCESLKKPKAWSAEAFGEGGYTVVPPEKEEDYRRRAMENAIAIRPELYARDCKPVWDGAN